MMAVRLKMPSTLHKKLCNFDKLCCLLLQSEFWSETRCHQNSSRILVRKKSDDHGTLHKKICNFDKLCCLLLQSKFWSETRWCHQNFSRIPVRKKSDDHGILQKSDSSRDPKTNSKFLILSFLYFSSFQLGKKCEIRNYLKSGIHKMGDLELFIKWDELLKLCLHLYVTKKGQGFLL